MKRIGILYLATLAALFGMSSCDTAPLESAVDNFALVIGLEPINTNSSILVYDASTNELVNQQITVTFGGADGDEVIDLFSDPVESTTFKGGTLNFGLSNSVMPDSTNPATISVTLNTPGYLEYSTQVQIADTGLTSFEVDMIPLNALPDNISQSTQSSQTDSNGDPIPPNDMNPPQGKVVGLFGQPTTQNLFSPLMFARNGANTVDAETFSTRFITRDANGDPQTKTGYFSSIQISQVSLGTDGEGLSPIPYSANNVRLYPGVQLVQTATSQDGEQIDAFLDAEGDGAGELWTYLGRDSQLQNSTTYKQFLAGNGWITQASKADYGYSESYNYETDRYEEKFEMIANQTEVVTINSSVSDFTQTQEFVDVLTADDDAPKLVLVNVPGSDDPYVWLAQKGQIFKYLTFALELPEKILHLRHYRNGNTGTIPLSYEVLGKKMSSNFQTNYVDGFGMDYFFPNIDFTFKVTAQLPWTTAVYNINPSTRSNREVVDITLPQKPTNLTAGTVQANMVCSNGAPGLRLSSLPGTPIQFRKVGSGNRWRQAQVTWNYDKAARVLRGGTFEAQLESGAQYEFQISVDGTLYPTDGPERQTITFDAQNKAAFNYSIDNDDFCTL